eukprot:CCRYP_019712-RB/>CCRYP_019712-RB protein AED:0.28 eAED:0.28 QI:307/1/1/1/0/0/2/307/155
MIWVFFPIPLLCLALLAVPFPKTEKLCTELVGSIFFTRISVGAVYIRLVWVFVAMSCLILWIAIKTLQMGFGSAHVPCSGTSCPFHTGETMWYRRASRYRAERNFWLSLFTLVLWLLVYKIYSLKETIVKLKVQLEAIRNDGYKPKKTDLDTKND